MRGEAPSHARLGGEATELNPDAGARPGSASRRTVDDAEQRPDRQLDACGKPGRQLLPAPGVHADLAPTATFAAAHEQRPAPRVKVALAEREASWMRSPPRQSTAIRARKRAPWRSSAVWRITAMISLNRPGFDGGRFYWV